MLIKNSQQTISINKLFKKLKWKKENQNYEKIRGVHVDNRFHCMYAKNKKNEEEN